MDTAGCGEVFRGRICPRCKRQFFICRHCDRGHVYCCRLCSALSRLEKIRIYRKRYRMSKEGREEHQDTERDRRRRHTLGEKNVGDQSSAQGNKSARVIALMRMLAKSADIYRLSKEDSDDDTIRCEFCGRPGNLVCFRQDVGSQRARSGFSGRDF